MTEQSHDSMRSSERSIGQESEYGANSLNDILSLLWLRRWLVLSITATLTIGAALTACLLPKKYEATVVVSPVSDEISAGRLGGLSSLMSQFGGLASLAGVSAPGNSMRAESIATIQSVSLTERFVQDNDLLPVLFARKWDATKKRWKTSDPRKVPTLWKANELFRKQLRSVVENKKSGLVYLTITWTDPSLAAQWANNLVNMTNEYLRSKAIQESERNIEYLSEQATNSKIIEVQKAIYSIMESELRKAMLAKGSEEYALRVIDRAVAPEKSSSPRLGLWIGAGFFGGFLSSILLVMTRRALIAR